MVAITFIRGGNPLTSSEPMIWLKSGWRGECLNMNPHFGCLKREAQCKPGFWRGHKPKVPVVKNNSLRPKVNQTMALWKLVHGWFFGRLPALQQLRRLENRALGGSKPTKEVRMSEALKVPLNLPVLPGYHSYRIDSNQGKPSRQTCGNNGGPGIDCVPSSGPPSDPSFTRERGKTLH